MICPNCKHEIPDDSIFCPDCGQKQNDTSIPDNQPDDCQENRGNQPSSPNNDIQEGSSQEEIEISFIKDGARYYCIGTSSTDETLSPHCLKLRHAGNCSGNLFLGDNAKCLCDKCGAMAPIHKWEIVETSDDKISYAQICKDANRQLDLQKALDIAAEITTVAGVKWLNKFTDSLMKDIEN